MLEIQLVYSKVMVIGDETLRAYWPTHLDLIHILSMNRAYYVFLKLGCSYEKTAVATDVLGAILQSC
jgi:hypothetical protein